MDKDIFLGCDIGTGSCKILATRSDGEVVKQVQSYYSPTHSEAGFAEEAPEIIFKAFIECLKRILPKLPKAPIAMGFSSAMHSLMPMDADNKPMTNLIVWEDNRSYQIAEELRKEDLGKQIYEKTGTPIHSMSPLCKIRWFHDHKSDLFARVNKFIGIKEYLWYRMFGVYEVDISIASAMGMMDINSLQWNEDSLQFSKVKPSQLSELKNTTFIRENPLKEFLDLSGLPANMKYCIGASDGCLANYGSGIHSADKAALTIGTSGAVRITSSKPIISSETMIFNYLLDKNVFICGGPVNNGGNVLLWLFKTFLKKEEPTAEDFDNLEKGLAFIPAGSGGLVCIPWFLGERAPVWDEKASGIWLGIKSYHTEFHFFRAALEGVCFTLRMILESMEKVSGNISTLYISGGFTRSPQWVQMMADITHKIVVISEGADASALGAILWTMKSLGMNPDTSAIAADEKIIVPNSADAEVLDRQYQIFRELYKNNATQMHELSE